MKTIFYNKEHNIRVKYALQLDNKPLFIMCLPENKVTYCKHETIAHDMYSYFYILASSMGNCEYIRLQKAMYRVIDIKLTKIKINEYATHIIKNANFGQDEHNIVVSIETTTLVLDKSFSYDLNRFIRLGYLKDIDHNLLKNICIDIKKYVDQNLN